MGTDSKYLEEAMAELERSFGTFSDNVEITSLIVNNLENRLDNVYVNNEVFSLSNRELTGDSFSGNYIKSSLRENKVTAKEIETGKKVYKYVVTYESKPILVEETGHYITLETGCYKWVEE